MRITCDCSQYTHFVEVLVRSPSCVDFSMSVREMSPILAPDWQKVYNFKQKEFQVKCKHFKTAHSWDEDRHVQGCSWASGLALGGGAPPGHPTAGQGLHLSSWAGPALLLSEARHIVSKSGGTAISTKSSVKILKVTPKEVFSFTCKMLTDGPFKEWKLSNQVMYVNTVLITTAVLFVCACAVPMTSSTTTTTTTAPSPTPVVSSSAPESEQSSQPSIRDAAVFLCADLVYQSELLAIFPPADSSVHNIINETRAKEYHDRSMDLFCENDTFIAYTLCVNILSIFRNKAIDRQIGEYIDMSKFGSAMKTYCINKELVKQNYGCVLDVVRSRSAPCQLGGMYGLMQGVGMGLRLGLSKEVYCPIRSAAISCRSAQFARCNGDLAREMESVYNDLSAKRCM
ncbi:hypothetical protein MAR_016627 [Mya arenaria]|uniref:Uncharacterized protein n=1 Tax=Mya arenaria TaxID=6604 RepID=A0ABY7FKC4_MYAAR|nr:hypothetical protein MAR_016627 [Mya arenaria]